MKKPKPSIFRRAFAQVRGLRIEWTDKNPFSESLPTDGSLITHDNPVYRCRASKIFHEFGRWLIEEQRLLWRASVHVVFRHPDEDERVTLEVEQVLTIGEINAAMNREIIAVLRQAGEDGYRDRYLHTEFQLHCLGQS